MDIRLCIAAAALAMAATAWAQPMNPGGPMIPAKGESPAGHGPMECGWHGCGRHGWTMWKNFFMPDMIMRHQKAIGLTEEQRNTIKTEETSFLTSVVDLQWQLSTEKGDLANLLSQDKPDEKAILAEAGKVMKLRGDIMLAHLKMFIRVKNALTPDQQKVLTELREHMERRPWAEPMLMWHRRGEMGPGEMRHGEMHPGAEHPANPE
jgi:Spy/CpxP family protein refolding chaperone